MTVLAIFFALLAALSNATAGVLQRRVTGQVHPQRLFHVSIIRAVIQRRLWLTGIALQVAGFFALAFALGHAPLVIVVPLSASGLIFLLLILHFGTNLDIGVREWTAVVAIAGGVAAFLALANPHGGHVSADALDWLTFLLGGGAGIALLATIMRATRYLPLRGALGGAAAGLHFAMTSAVTKLVVEQLKYGVWHQFLSWELYALIIVGVSSALTMQSMYGAGPLTFSQPALEISRDVCGVIFGLVMFDDFITHTPVALAGAIVSAIVVIVGIILLAGSRRLHSGDRLASEPFVLRGEHSNP